TEPAARYELKSQYGHLRTHHGRWTYSESGRERDGRLGGIAGSLRIERAVAGWASDAIVAALCARPSTRSKLGSEPGEPSLIIVAIIGATNGMVTGSRLTYTPDCGPGGRERGTRTDGESLHFGRLYR